MKRELLSLFERLWEQFLAEANPRRARRIQLQARRVHAQLLRSRR